MFFGKKKMPTGNIDYIIVGLGNPGGEYEATRHNAGFIVIDMLAEECSCEVTKLKFKSLYGTAQIGDKKCILMKPQTYMNNSGEAVRDAAAFYKIPAERIIVISDDISLDVGKLRIKRKGSDGGHNGLKSIIYQIQSDNFARIKMGVGKKPHPEYDLAAWVLSRFKNDEAQPLKSAAKNACDAIKLIVGEKIDMAMNKFNS